MLRGMRHNGGEHPRAPEWMYYAPVRLVVLVFEVLFFALVFGLACSFSRGFFSAG